MNVRNLFFIVLGAAALQACNKSADTLATTDEVVTTTSTETIAAVVTQNAKSMISLPSSTSGYTISTEASHATVSMIGTDESGNTLYTYQPADNYTGTDAVILTSSDTTAAPGGCDGHGKGGGKPHGGGGNCQHNDDSTTNSSNAKHVNRRDVHVNITVAPSTVSS